MANHSSRQKRIISQGNSWRVDLFHTGKRGAEWIRFCSKKRRRDKLKKFKDLTFGQHPGGSGWMAQEFFENGYGISVVRFSMVFGGFGSYTDNEDEWEVAVLSGKPDNFDIVYSTHITDDVIGHLSDKDVTEVMEKIQSLEVTDSNSRSESPQKKTQ